MSKEAAKTGKGLERRVAQAFRQMGAWKVEHDVSLAGNQIDVYVELATPGHFLHCIAVEVKDWSKPVGIDVVNGFGDIVRLLHHQRLVDEGVIVSASGFTRPARSAAETYSLRLLEMTDLDAMVTEALQWFTPSFIPLSPPDPAILSEPGPLPPDSRVPFRRNELFTGRFKPLKALAHTFLHDRGTSTVITQAVQGMGGVGKTQLAVEFAYRYGRYFDGVHWLSVAQSNHINDEIAACGAAMCLRQWPKNINDRVIRTLHEWRQSGSRLIILDGLNDVDIAREWLSKLSGGRLHLLITSRLSDWPADLGLELLPLDVFTLKESHNFLRHSLSPERASDTDLEALAKRLGHLPLALELAARYLSRFPRLSVADFLNELEDIWTHPSMAGWREDLGNPTGHDLDLATAFTLSWERVTDAVAQHLFLLAGCCAPVHPIPLKLLEKSAGLETRTCDEALRILTGLGLLEMENSRTGLLIHPLLAEYARTILLRSFEREKAKGKGVPTPLVALADTLATLAYQAIESGIPARFMPLQPHVEAVATAAENARLERAGALWDSLGCGLRMVADYEEALKACRRAVAIAKGLLGSDHPDVAIYTSTLGWVLKDLGDLNGALDCFQRALEIDEARFGPSSPKIVSDLDCLGLVLKDRMDLDRALEYLERALEINGAALDPDHPHIARDTRNLGLVLEDLGDLDGAIDCFQRALEIDEARFGPSSPKIVSDLDCLGWALRDLGDWTEAREVFGRALRIDRTAFGPAHPNVAHDINSIGWVLRDLGELPEARRAFEQALVIWQAVYGEESPQVAKAQGDLGLVLRDLGDLGGAREIFERALMTDKAIFGPNHCSVARDLSNLGMVLHDLADLDGAREALENTLGILQRTHREQHPQASEACNSLGLVLLDLGDLAGAREAIRRAMMIDEQVYGLDHWNFARDLNSLGMVLRNLWKPVGARAAFEWALMIDEQVFSPKHPNVARDLNNLGIVLHDLADLDGARRALGRALEIDEAMLGPNHPNLARDANNLGEVLKAQGDLEGALSLFTRALLIDEAVFGSEHPNFARDIRSIGRMLEGQQDLAGARYCYTRALVVDEAVFGPSHCIVAYGLKDLGSMLRDQNDLVGARYCLSQSLCVFEKSLPLDHPYIRTAREELESLKRTARDGP